MLFAYLLCRKIQRRFELVRYSSSFVRISGDCLGLPWVAQPSRFEEDLRSSFLVWGLCVVFGLIPSVSILFGVTRAGLSSNSANATLCFCNATANHDTKTLGPVILKATLVATPILLILLLNTANDAKEFNDVVYKQCVQLAVDLLDAVEMIDIVLDEQEHNYRISKGFGIAMITVACFSFLLSFWPMIETIDWKVERKRSQQ